MQEDIWLAFWYIISSGLGQQGEDPMDQKCGSIKTIIEVIHLCSPKFSTLSTNKP